MKNILFLFLIISMLIISANGQEITYQDFKEIIPFLQQEDFQNAYLKSSKLLNSTTNENSDLRAIVTYMNIYSAAGMVTLDQMTFEEFEESTKVFIGQNIVMSAHPCIDSTKHSYSSLQFTTTNDGELNGMTITANKDMTNILCFEYFKYEDKIDPNELIGKNIRCGGILESIEINPNKSKLWISRLKVKNAFARIMTPR